MTAIERIEGRASAIAEGMTVVRALPTRQRRMVGAWCFLDHLGPLQFPAGGGMHVGAHPHTALQTFTWLIEGEVLHRDSLGSEQIIRPGQVNLMTAGRGIVHTEDSLADGQRLHAAQLWIALPASAAECPPAFEHFPELPRWQQDGLAFTLLAGRFAGRTMPARFHTPLVGLDVDAPAGGTTRLAVDPAFEYGILTLSGEVLLDGERFGADTFAGLAAGRQHLDIAMAAGSRLLLLGGQPLAEPVLMWWSFVGHNRQAIIDAQRDWEQGAPRFSAVPGAVGRLVAPPLPWGEVAGSDRPV